MFLLKRQQKILGSVMENQLLHMSYTKAFFNGKFLKQKERMYLIALSQSLGLQYRLGYIQIEKKKPFIIIFK